MKFCSAMENQIKVAWTSVDSQSPHRCAQPSKLAIFLLLPVVIREARSWLDAGVHFHIIYSRKKQGFKEIIVVNTDKNTMQPLGRQSRMSIYKMPFPRNLKIQTEKLKKAKTHFQGPDTHTLERSAFSFWVAFLGGKFLFSGIKTCLLGDWALYRI